MLNNVDFAFVGWLLFFFSCEDLTNRIFGSFYGHEQSGMGRAHLILLNAEASGKY